MWWARQDSNLRQHRYERRVLTTELQALKTQVERRAADVPQGRGKPRPYVRGAAEKPPERQAFVPLTPARSQVSRKLRSLRERLGCLSLRSAFASIWRMRS